MMGKRRPARRPHDIERERAVGTCANLILNALREAGSLSRHDLVARGLVSASEAERGLRWLRESGKIQRCPLSDRREARVVRYELSTAAPKGTPPAGKLRTVCFEGLLKAWQISQPPAIRAWRHRYVNDAFAREEQRELAELREGICEADLDGTRERRQEQANASA